MSGALENWRRLRDNDETPDPGLFNAMNVTEGVWLAVDDGNRASLLVEVPEGTIRVDTRARLLRPDLQEMEVPGTETLGTLASLCLDDPRFEEVFAAFADEVVQELDSMPIDDRNDALQRLLNIWRYFWTNPDGSLSFEEEIGLFGELLFLADWLPDVATGVQGWTGGGFKSTTRDFQLQAFDIEVKTARSLPTGITHRIHGLSQLDTSADHPLFLFSCAVSPDDESGLTVRELAERVLERINGDPETADLFNGKLASRGYRPDSEKFQALSVDHQRLFRVKGSFPRLARGSIPGGPPVGIPPEQVNYNLEIAACGNWLVKDTPPMQ